MWHSLHRRWSGNGRGWRCRRRKQSLQRTGADMAFGCWPGKLCSEQTFHAADEFLRLKGFADKFVSLHGDGLVRNSFVHHSGHQDDRNRAVFRVLLDLRADRVAVLVRHDDVGYDRIGRIVRELPERGSGVAASDYVDALAAESNLDDFAHGGAVVDEIDRGRALRGRIGQGRYGHCFAHEPSLSAMSRAPSSNSRMASSMRSVELRSTVCCVEVLPYTNL